MVDESLNVVEDNVIVVLSQRLGPDVCEGRQRQSTYTDIFA